MIPAMVVGEHKAMAQVEPGAVGVVGQSRCLRLRTPVKKGIHRSLANKLISYSNCGFPLYVLMDWL